MLTAFKGDLSQGRMDAEICAWGKDLLSNTRLLLDSPAAHDPVRPSCCRTSSSCSFRSFSYLRKPRRRIATDRGRADRRPGNDETSHRDSREAEREETIDHEEHLIAAAMISLAAGPHGQSPPRKFAPRTRARFAAREARAAREELGSLESWPRRVAGAWARRSGGLALSPRA